jgi:hypothetical protein
VRGVTTPTVSKPYARGRAEGLTPVWLVCVSLCGLCGLWRPPLSADERRGRRRGGCREDEPPHGGASTHALTYTVFGGALSSSRFGSAFGHRGAVGCGVSTCDWGCGKRGHTDGRRDPSGATSDRHRAERVMHGVMHFPKMAGVRPPFGAEASCALRPTDPSNGEVVRGLTDK